METAGAATAARVGAPMAGAPAPNFGKVSSRVKSGDSGGSLPLGKSAKSVDAGAGKRRQRYRLQTVAAKLLPKERVAHCCRTPTGGNGCGSAIVIVASSDSAAYRGLQTCGSIWLCPVCSGKISNVRRKELNALLAWAREQPGLYPVMLSLTISHTERMGLRAALNLIKRAKRRFHQSRCWRSLATGLSGHVTATEVNKSRRHGWHPHFHTVLLVRAASEAEAVEAVERCRDAWGAALEALGGWCNAHGFQVQGGGAAGDYVSKWGAAEELALGGSKEGRAGKGWTPWQLLAMAETGDETAVAGFREYARVFKGRRQLSWSRGLKSVAGIGEVSDEQAASEPELELSVEAEVAALDQAAWQRIARAELRAHLMWRRVDSLQSPGSLRGPVLSGCTLLDGEEAPNSRSALGARSHPKVALMRCGRCIRRR